MINLGYKIQLNSWDFLVSLAHDVWKVSGECLSVSQNLLLKLDYYPPASIREDWHTILFLKSQHISSSIKLIEFFHFRVFKSFPPVSNFRMPRKPFQSHVFSIMMTVVKNRVKKGENNTLNRTDQCTDHSDSVQNIKRNKPAVTPEWISGITLTH